MKFFITLIFLLLISYILTADLGDSCTGNEDCSVENAVCSTNCICKDNYVEELKKREKDC